jgi:hypothetical protein
MSDEFIECHPLLKGITRTVNRFIFEILLVLMDFDLPFKEGGPIYQGKVGSVLLDFYEGSLIHFMSKFFVIAFRTRKHEPLEHMVHDFNENAVVFDLWIERIDLFLKGSIVK